MKKAAKAMTYGLIFILAAGLALAAYIRLAPSDPADWHVSPRLALWDLGGPWDQVVTARNGASLRLHSTDARALLAQLDSLAMATLRTSRLAGSVQEGRITWVSRSRLIGYPDYTTAEARAEGLYILARQRFGQGDWGVNAARLTHWLALLDQSR